MKSKDKPPKPEFSFEATGTKWTVSTPETLSLNTSSSIVDCAEQFESLFSRFRDDSQLREMAVSSGVFIFPEYTAEMFAVYERLEALSEGRITPLIGKNLAQAGYDAALSFKPSKLTANKRLAELLTIDGSTIYTATPVELDFAAAGKGLLIDRIAKLLEAQGIDTYVVNGGGDIRTKKPIRVGLENPLNTQQLIGVTQLTSGALCGSSSNRRQWHTFSHIIDGRDRRSPTKVIASWVTAESAMLADALATSLMIVEPKALTEFEFEYLLVHSDGRIKQSSGFHYQPSGRSNLA